MSQGSSDIPFRTRYFQSGSRALPYSRERIESPFTAALEDILASPKRVLARVIVAWRPLSRSES